MNKYMRIADILYDFDKQIEQLEKENAELKARVDKQDSDILFLENLTESLRTQIKALEGQNPWKDIKDKSELIGKLTKAKELLTKIMKNTWSIDCFLVKEVEQFLNEVEK